MMTAYQRSALEAAILRLNSGERLMQHITEAGHRVWQTCDGGPIPSGVIEDLNEVGALELGGDGLFGDSQTAGLGSALMPYDDFVKKRLGQKHVVIHGRSKKAEQYRDLGYRIVTKGEYQKVKSEYDFISRLVVMPAAPALGEPTP
jgi:hypothetical protein